MAAIQQTLTDEVLDFLASAPSTEEILAFQPSKTMKERSHYLLDRNRKDILTSDERAELDEFLRMNHFVNMLKIRIRQKYSLQ